MDLQTDEHPRVSTRPFMWAATSTRREYGTREAANLIDAVRTDIPAVVDLAGLHMVGLGPQWSSEPRMEVGGAPDYSFIFGRRRHSLTSVVFGNPSGRTEPMATDPETAAEIVRVARGRVGHQAQSSSRDQSCADPEKLDGYNGWTPDRAEMRIALREFNKTDNADR